jgi:predicted DNA-binding transcriptional regulator AlpA
MPSPNTPPFWQKPPPRSPAPAAQRTPPGGESKPETFLTWKDLFARGLISSRTSARRLWTQGKFPKPVHLSERVIAWRESEIDAWAASRVHAPQPPHGIAAQPQARKRLT